MVQALATNNYGPAKWIVDPTLANGTHSTIATALTSASSGDTIFIRPGTYTENLTLKAGVNLTAYGCDSGIIGGVANVIINGTCSFSSAGTVTISGIMLQTNGATALLSITGSAASIVKLNGCNLNCTSNTGITFSTANASAALNIFNCTGDLTTTGIAYFSDSSTGATKLVNCVLGNSGASSTANTKSAGSIGIENCQIFNPITYSSSNTLSSIEYSTINSANSNSTSITTSGTGTISLSVSSFNSGSASAISIGSGTTVLMNTCVVASSNTNSITGAGTLTYAGISFASSSSTVNTTTQTAQISKLGISLSDKQPAFLGISGTQTNVTGDGTTYTVTFATEVFDQNSNFDGTSTFTAPYTGRYSLSTNVVFTGIGAANTGNNAVSLVTSNRTYGHNVGNLTTCKDATNNVLPGLISVLADMDAADTCTVTALASGGTKTVGVQTTNSYFSGILSC